MTATELVLEDSGTALAERTLGGSPPTEASRPGGDAAPSVSPDDLLPSARWPMAVPIALTIAFLVLIAMRRLSLRTEGLVEDSEDFREALRIWHPVIFAANPTPRGVKRHHNRLRFHAMRLRPQAEQSDWIDRMFAGPDGPPAGSPTEIPDETLVALGALEARDAALLQELDESGEITTGTNKGKEISEAIYEFQESFRDAWPPTSEQVTAFRALSSSVRA